MSSQDEVKRVFSAEQIAVPPALPGILKAWTKEVVRKNPSDVTAWSKKYFERLQQDAREGREGSDP
jgi:hypothetical protein